MKLHHFTVGIDSIWRLFAPDVLRARQPSALCFVQGDFPGTAFPTAAGALMFTSTFLVPPPAGKQSPIISAKPVGVEAASQPWILKGEQCGLLTRIATTESISLCVRMKS
ncbi:MAG TPA: hypothetical protein VL136_03940 [Candidatus Babeliales bacterium]|nr:hypothetical protein [Candidatus Babeliales bacterium]